MMAEDIEAGMATCASAMSTRAPFQLGVNMANTPGKVIFCNELIELIQYESSTPQVYKRLLLIVLPWINKFWILDLNPEKSWISAGRWRKA